MENNQLMRPELEDGVEESLETSIRPKLLDEYRKKNNTLTNNPNKLLNFWISLNSPLTETTNPERLPVFIKLSISFHIFESLL